MARRSKPARGGQRTAATRSPEAVGRLAQERIEEAFENLAHDSSVAPSVPEVAPNTLKELGASSTELQSPDAVDLSPIRDPRSTISKEPLPARMLNEFVYCPRLFYYEFVEGVFVHNADTLRGAAIHTRVDSGSGAMPPVEVGKSEARSPKPEKEEPDVIHSRSVSLGSERLGVTAKMDLVEVRASDTGDSIEPDLFSKIEVCPVDYKAGAPR